MKREIPKDGYPIPPYLVAHEGINEEGPPGQIKLTRTRRIEEIGRDI